MKALAFEYTLTLARPSMVEMNSDEIKRIGGKRNTYVVSVKPIFFDGCETDINSASKKVCR